MRKFHPDHGSLIESCVPTGTGLSAQVANPVDTMGARAVGDGSIENEPFLWIACPGIVLTTPTETQGPTVLEK
jgi:hypothetical protein